MLVRCFVEVYTLERMNTKYLAKGKFTVVFIDSFNGCTLLGRDFSRLKVYVL
jgi:hypothetical protein